MTNPVYADIVNDMGTTVNNFHNGTTAVKSFISKAQRRIAGITGTTVAYDGPIRNLADAYASQSLMGSLGPESVAKNAFAGMRDGFIKDVEKELMVSGFTFDGKSVKFKQVNG